MGAKREHASVPNPKRRTVEVEQAILLDDSLSLGSLGLYVVLLFHPNSSISELSRYLKVQRETVLAHFKELEKAGWATRDKHRLISPAQPKSVQESKIGWLKQVLQLKPYIGETLSFAWLDEWIDSNDYVDHARPSFLKNPTTGQPMEYDRIYPAFRTAFEHQGLQHYGPTAMFPDAAKAREQELRDYAKKGMSVEHGITLITITWEDISFKGMKEKIPDTLPKRNLNPDDQYIQFLEQESSKYRALMRRILREQSP